MKCLYYLATFFSVILLRYFIVAGGAYWWFYFLANKPVRSDNIQSPNFKSIKNDIALSVITTVALAICSTLIMTNYDFGKTRLYLEVGDRGIMYLINSFIGIILLQDTCFYFFHRVFHHPALYNWLHRGHHRSKNPTPWTSFALDFPEALVQGLFLIAVVFIIPLHIYILALLLTTMTVWALINHLGFELFPHFPYHWLGKWFISANHHSLHHRNHTRHYGLYFTFWDRLLGTN